MPSTFFPPVPGALNLTPKSPVQPSPKQDLSLQEIMAPQAQARAASLGENVSLPEIATRTSRSSEQFSGQSVSLPGMPSKDFGSSSQVRSKQEALPRTSSETQQNPADNFAKPPVTLPVQESSSEQTQPRQRRRRPIISEIEEPLFDTPAQSSEPIEFGEQFQSRRPRSAQKKTPITISHLATSQSEAPVTPTPPSSAGSSQLSSRELDDISLSLTSTTPTPRSPTPPTEPKAPTPTSPARIFQKVLSPSEARKRFANTEDNDQIEEIISVEDLSAANSDEENIEENFSFEGDYLPEEILEEIALHESMQQENNLEREYSDDSDWEELDHDYDMTFDEEETTDKSKKNAKKSATSNEKGKAVATSDIVATGKSSSSSNAKTSTALPKTSKEKYFEALKKHGKLTNNERKIAGSSEPQFRVSLSMTYDDKTPTAIRNAYAKMSPLENYLKKKTNLTPLLKEYFTVTINNLEKLLEKKQAKCLPNTESEQYLNVAKKDLILARENIEAAKKYPYVDAQGKAGERMDVDKALIVKIKEAAEWLNLAENCLKDQPKKPEKSFNFNDSAIENFLRKIDSSEAKISEITLKHKDSAKAGSFNVEEQAFKVGGKTYQINNGLPTKKEDLAAIKGFVAAYEENEYPKAYKIKVAEQIEPIEKNTLQETPKTAVKSSKQDASALSKPNLQTVR